MASLGQSAFNQIAEAYKAQGYNPQEQNLYAWGTDIDQNYLNQIINQIRALPPGPAGAQTVPGGQAPAGATWGGLGQSAIQQIAGAYAAKGYDPAGQNLYAWGTDIDQNYLNNILHDINALPAGGWKPNQPASTPPPTPTTIQPIVPTGGAGAGGGAPVNPNDPTSILSAVYQRYGLDPNNPGVGDLANVGYFVQRLNQTGGMTPQNVSYWQDRLAQQIVAAQGGPRGPLIDTPGGGGGSAAGGGGGGAAGGGGYAGGGGGARGGSGMPAITPQPMPPTFTYQPWTQTFQGPTLDTTPFTYQPWTQQFQAPTDITEQNDPGYQARLALGQQALQRSAAAQGTLNTGGTEAALTQYAQNYASNEYQNVYNRALGQYQQAYQQYLGGYGQALQTYQTQQQAEQQAYGQALGTYQQNYNQYLQGYQQALGTYETQYGAANNAYQQAWNQYLQQYQQGQNAIAQAYQQQVLAAQINQQNVQNAFQQQVFGAQQQQQAYANTQNEQQTQWNNLYNLYSLGYGASGGANASGSNYGSNASNLLTGIGNTTAAGQVGSANAYGNLMSQLGGAAMYSGLYGSLYGNKSGTPTTPYAPGY
jgi:hypothetical protein